MDGQTDGEIDGEGGKRERGADRQRNKIHR